MASTKNLFSLQPEDKLINTNQISLTTQCAQPGLQLHKHPTSLVGQLRQHKLL